MKACAGARRCVATALLGLAAGLTAQAPAVPAAAPLDLADLLAPIRTGHGVPALGAAVVRDGRLHALGVTGLRRHGHEATVTREDRWHLGSCTKAMTALLLAQRVDAAAITFASTVGEALPALAAGMDPVARTITVQQLLSHRAGLAKDPPPDLWAELFRWAGTLPEARTEVCRRLLAVAPRTAPGAQYEYTNNGYVIAGAIDESLAGVPWEQRIARDLWQPLGITTAGFGAPGRADATEQPWGHRHTAAGPRPQFADNPPAHGPAGTVHMALGDWVRFVQHVLGEPGPDGAPALAASARRLLHQPAPDADYALGWRLTQRPWSAGPVLCHSGSNTMWYCVAWLAPRERYAVLVVCNQGDAEAACDAVAAACLAAHAPRPR